MVVLKGKENNYTIQKELGRGQYGITYLAIGDYGDRYAIKQFIEQGSEETRDFEQNVLEEITTVCKTHAVCFIESITDGGKFYIVMDYIDGPNVNDLIFGKNKLTKTKRRELGEDFIRDLISGINAIHRLGLIHQDIKAENLMYPNRNVKLIDFGVSCLTETGDKVGNFSVFGIGVNQPCGIAGSPITVPPEMAGDIGIYRLVDLIAHDVWSAGCVILSWYTVEDNDYSPENHAYYKEFDDVNKYNAIMKELRNEHELAYQVIVGLLNRDPIQRVDNFNQIADYFGAVFSMFSQPPEFQPNWYNTSVSQQAKKDICDFRIEVKKSGLRLPGILIGLNKC